MTLQELIALAKQALEKYLNEQNNGTGGNTGNAGGENGGSGEQVIDSDKFYGLFLTDVLCEPNLENREPDLKKLRTKYNTILSVLDLQKNGAKATRPYVQWARGREEINSLGVKNIKLLKSLGFKLVVVCLNSWGAKHGFGDQMGSTQESVPNGEAGLYSSKQLAREMRFYEDFLSKVGDNVDVIMPLLEAIQPQAANFGTELAKHIRSLGYKGQIWFNHLSEARSNLNSGVLSGLGVKMASSVNTPDAWSKSSDPIRNADGMTVLKSSDTALISKLTSTPGKDGFILWASDLIGSASGRPTYSDNWVKYASQGGSVVVKPNDPKPEDPKPENPNESPEQRHKRLYPHVKLTGGNAGTATNQTLWKPQADVNGKPTGNLVVVTAHNFPKIRYVSVEKGGTVLEKKDISSVTTAGNGYRCNFRFGKKGGSYGTGLTLRVSTVEGDFTGSIPNGGSRVNPVNMKKISNISVPQDPKPDPKPDEPKPQDPVTTVPNKWFICGSDTIWFHPKLQTTVERAVMCYNLPNNLYENAKYVGNNTWKFSKPFSAYQRGSRDSVIGVAVKSMVPELKDVYRSNKTYQIFPLKNDWDFPHVTAHDPVPPPNGNGPVIDPKPNDPKPQDPPPTGSWPHGNTWLYQYADGRLDVHPKLIPWLNTAKNRAVMFVYNVNAWVYPGGFSFDRANKIGDFTFKAPKALNQYPRGNVGGKGWLAWRLELDPSKTAEYHRSYAALGLPKFKSPQNDNGTRSIDPNFTGQVSLEVK